MFPTGNMPGLTNIYPHNHPPSTMQYQSQIPTFYTNGMHSQTTPNQVSMFQQYRQSPTQVPLAPISTPMANHPTTSSQPTTSQNNGRVYYMTYSDDDSIFNDDKDEESGNTHPWQAVVKKTKKKPPIQTNRTP